MAVANRSWQELVRAGKIWTEMGEAYNSWQELVRAGKS
jgi:hypothetical protein